MENVLFIYCYTCAFYSIMSTVQNICPPLHYKTVDIKYKMSARISTHTVYTIYIFSKPTRGMSLTCTYTASALQAQHLPKQYCQEMKVDIDQPAHRRCCTPLTRLPRLPLLHPNMNNAWRPHYLFQTVHAGVIQAELAHTGKQPARPTLWPDLRMNVRTGLCTDTWHTRINKALTHRVSWRQVWSELCWREVEQL